MSYMEVDDVKFNVEFSSLNIIRSSLTPLNGHIFDIKYELFSKYYHFTVKCQYCEFNKEYSATSIIEDISQINDIDIIKKAFVKKNELPSCISIGQHKYLEHIFQFSEKENLYILKCNECNINCKIPKFKINKSNTIDIYFNNKLERIIKYSCSEQKIKNIIE